MNKDVMNTLQQTLNHPIILEMVSRGIEPKIKAVGLELEGFYKSGTVILFVDHKNKLMAIDRYSMMTTIETLQDLVELNLYWWSASMSRSPNWVNPSEPWRSIAIEMGLLEVKETIVKEYVRK